MSAPLIVLIIVIAVLVVMIIAGNILNKRMERRNAENQAQLEAHKQTVTLLIIDKKRCKLKESGLPQQVIQETPWYARRAKVPMVRAKAGPQIVDFVCDDKVFDIVPVKKQVKATISGGYILDVRGMRGARLTSDAPKKKKGFWARMRDRAGANSVK